MGKVGRALLIAGGTICVGLGILGVFLPILPTTPFLLLAAACYARSSRRFYRWLTTNRWFGAYIRHYRDGLGISLRHKVITLALLWGTIGYAVGFVLSSWWLRGLLLAIACGVTWHLLAIKTYRVAE